MSLSSVGIALLFLTFLTEDIIDTTLCGDWAGTSYSSYDCPGSCEARVADPASFVNATWSINSLKIYNKTIINTAYLEAAATTTSSSILLTLFACILLSVSVTGLFNALF
ncbi:hypothetical protein FS842_003646 [Serendipita sp. 407]|nr:hypothetical protein FS842_003646 [Serendipita sp. 407]